MPVPRIYHHLGVWHEGGVTVVRFGDHRILDALAVSHLGEELSAVAERDDCRKLLLNFSSVEYLTSLMLGKLVMLKRKMEAKGGSLKLSDAGPQVLEILTQTRLDQIIEVHDSEIEALRAFAASA